MRRQPATQACRKLTELLQVLQEQIEAVVAKQGTFVQRFHAGEHEAYMKAFGNCGFGHKNVILTPSGKIKACAFFPEGHYLGDVRKESLESIFRKPAFSGFRNLQPPSKESCGKCAYEQYCLTCPARALVVIKQEGRLCAWAEANKKLFSPAADLTFDPSRPYFTAEDVRNAIQSGWHF